MRMEEAIIDALIATERASRYEWLALAKQEVVAFLYF